MREMFFLWNYKPYVGYLAHWNIHVAKRNNSNNSSKQDQAKVLLDNFFVVDTSIIVSLKIGGPLHTILLTFCLNILKNNMF